MFQREREEYRNEGVDWIAMEDYGADLQPTIDLIEKPMGLLSLLQEECIVPNGSDTSLLEKLSQQLVRATSSPSVFAKVKHSSRNASATSHFTIAHYAGVVAYNIDGWVEKNRDQVDQCILEMLSKSTHCLIAQLFPQRMFFCFNVPIETFAFFSQPNRRKCRVRVAALSPRPQSRVCTRSNSWS